MPVDRAAATSARAVVGAVVDDDDLVAVRRRVQRGRDAVDLRAQVPRLVVDGQDRRSRRASVRQAPASRAASCVPEATGRCRAIWGV